MIALQTSPKIECLDWEDRPQNYKGLNGILQLLQLLRGETLNYVTVATDDF